MSIYKCNHCLFHSNSSQKFSVHVYNDHGIKIHNYYDDNIKKQNENTCMYCGNETHFVSISKGYKQTCKSPQCIKKLRSDSAKKLRNRIKSDVVASGKMSKKISKNQKNIWSKRKESGEDVVIRKKIGETISQNNLNMTKEELSNRYGWLNKKSESEKLEWIKNSLETGMHRWWQTAPVEEIIEKVFYVSKRYLQGQFKPINPKKYKGDPTRIMYRSSLELRCMTHFDIHPNIIWWQSEEVVVPYHDISTGRNRRYFPDFVINIKNKEGVVETLMIEVKPLAQTMEPKKQKSSSKRYINEVYTWGTNSAKWAHAEKYCAERKWKFIILTEKEILGFSRN